MFNMYAEPLSTRVRPKWAKHCVWWATVALCLLGAAFVCWGCMFICGFFGAKLGHVEAVCGVLGVVMFIASTICSFVCLNLAAHAQREHLIAYVGYFIVSLVPVLNFCGVATTFIDLKAALRLRAEREHGVCKHCQYDLTGIPQTSPCPECGTTVAAHGTGS